MPLCLNEQEKKEKSHLFLNKIAPPRCEALKIKDEEFNTDQNAGPLIFMPLIQELQIVECIKKAGFPKTSVIDDVSAILSLLALKLLGNERNSHDVRWNLDRALGFFAKLNCLPKSTTLSTYSYRVTREQNKWFLKELMGVFKEDSAGEFNLDFKTIPHFGDESVLEKNWAGSQSKALKSIVALIVSEPSDMGFISYTDAEIKHNNQNDAVLEFVDFWKEGRGENPKMLIFDSRFTTLENLNKLDNDNIKFITLRRRGKNLIANLDKVPENHWKMIRIHRSNMKISMG